MKGSSFSSVAYDLKKKKLIRLYEIYNNETCDNYGKARHKNIATTLKMSNLSS